MREAEQDLARAMAAQADRLRLALRAEADRDPAGALTAGLAHAREQLGPRMSDIDFIDQCAETLAHLQLASRLGWRTPSDPLSSLLSLFDGPQLPDPVRRAFTGLSECVASVDQAGLRAALTGSGGEQFFEAFSAHYDPRRRAARGVWYTPAPVVDFVLEAVDTALREDLALPLGIADPAMRGGTHRVQLLDFATGTGTFLARAIRMIHRRVHATAGLSWDGYVAAHLLPRLHGLELQLAPQAVCHARLAALLVELGARPRADVGAALDLRLADALDPDTYAKSDDPPINCVVGNPPYNASSRAPGPWMAAQMTAYRAGLRERKVNLSDDYLRFIRLAEHHIERAGEGVVALVTNRSYLDGVTQRGMRAHLMETFDRIEIYDLHGDTRGGSTASGARDENIFDITQGVAVTVMVRTPGTRPHGARCEVAYCEQRGSRAHKLGALADYPSLQTRLEPLAPAAPRCFFVPRTASSRAEGFSLEDFFERKSSGIQTKNDEVTVAWTREELRAVLGDFTALPLDELERRYPSKGAWSTRAAREDIQSGDYEIRRLLYRPFDVRYTALTRRSGGFLGRPRHAVMQHIGDGDLSLVVNNKHVGDVFSHVFVADTVATHGVNYLGNRGQDYVCPLFAGPTDATGRRRANFDDALWDELRRRATDAEHGEPTPLDAFDYIYAVLHDPGYRRAFRDELRVGFPVIPWPSTPAAFWRHVANGSVLRRAHLLDPDALGDPMVVFMGEGEAQVKRVRFVDGAVWINGTQRFEGVSEAVWALQIGGYRVAEKWLKDRRGRVLSAGELERYGQIVTALETTDNVAACY